MPFNQILYADACEIFNKKTFVVRQTDLKMLVRSYLRHISRLCFRNIGPGIFLLICFYLILIYQEKSYDQLDDSSTTTTTTTTTITKMIESCDYKPKTDEFILNYQPNRLLGTKTNIRRVEPTVERIRTLLEIIRSKEAQYQSLLEKFDVFDMLKPMLSLKAYSNESNIDEIKTLYNRFIKLMPDKKTIDIDPKFIDYLRIISSYLSDGLRNQRTKQVSRNQSKIFLFLSFEISLKLNVFVNLFLCSLAMHVFSVVWKVLFIHLILIGLIIKLFFMISVLKMNKNN